MGWWFINEPVGSVSLNADASLTFMKSFLVFQMGTLKQFIFIASYRSHWRSDMRISGK